MKVILIAWYVISGTSTATTTVEFESIEACEKAGKALQVEGKSGSNTVSWRYICAPTKIE